VETDALTALEITRLTRVLPGQSGYRAHGETEAFFDNEDLEGVVHVVDYGYSVPRDSVVARKLVRDGYDTFERIRALNLESEMNSFRELLANFGRHIRVHGGPKWLIVAVNKIDLYPEKIDSALDYYHFDGTGAFGGALSDFRNQMGSENVKILLAKTCAGDDPLSWQDTHIESRIGMTDQRNLVVDLLSLISVISKECQQ
jgi:hypothetical protein